MLVAILLLTLLLASLVMLGAGIVATGVGDLGWIEFGSPDTDWILGRVVAGCYTPSLYITTVDDHHERHTVRLTAARIDRGSRSDRDTPFGTEVDPSTKLNQLRSSPPQANRPGSQRVAQLVACPPWTREVVGSSPTSLTEWTPDDCTSPGFHFVPCTSPPNRIGFGSPNESRPIMCGYEDPKIEETPKSRHVISNPTPAGSGFEFKIEPRWATPRDRFDGLFSSKVDLFGERITPPPVDPERPFMPAHPYTLAEIDRATRIGLQLLGPDGLAILPVEIGTGAPFMALDQIRRRVTTSPSCDCASCVMIRKYVRWLDERHAKKQSDSDRVDATALAMQAQKVEPDTAVVTQVSIEAKQLEVMIAGVKFVPEVFQKPPTAPPVVDPDRYLVTFLRVCVLLQTENISDREIGFTREDIQYEFPDLADSYVNKCLRRIVDRGWLSEHGKNEGTESDSFLVSDEGIDAAWSRQIVDRMKAEVAEHFR